MEQAQLANKPDKAPLVLATLILGAIVANLNLSIANIALPDIGRDLGATQVELTMVASMFTLGLAATVLYLGAVGDRYGRKKLLLAGAVLSIPAALLSAYAPTIQVLILARLLGGFAAGMLFPTTLSLISALWHGQAKTKAIALWSGIGGSAAALGGVVAGLLLEKFWWGSVFLITIPLAVPVLIVAFLIIPSKSGEEATPVDHLGGILSIIAVASLVLGIQKLPDGFTTTVIISLLVSAVAFILLFLQLRRAPHPLVDLKLASVPTFWVAFVGGTISFGSLVGAMFLGQQFVQNVLHYDTLSAALVVLPCSVFLIVSAPISAKLIIAKGSRDVLTWGMLVVALGFIVMIVGWNQNTELWVVLLAYAILGIGVGLSSTPASRSLMSSLPIARAGMGSAFTDLSRDFGGAIMQAVMGTVLAVTYGASLTKQAASVSPQVASQVSVDARNQIMSSYQSAEVVAQSYPAQLQSGIVEAATKAFTEGKSVAYIFGLVATLLAAGIVMWKYPRHDREMEIFREIEAADRELKQTELTDTSN